MTQVGAAPGGPVAYYDLNVGAAFRLRPSSGGPP